MKANRAITQATGKVVSAGSSGVTEEVVGVSNLSRRVVQDLLQACKATALAAEDTQAREEALKAGADIAKDFQDLLRKVDR